ncbi:alpha/beta hydrolase [Planktosalinus lacus]|uniref:Esterase n=1 Tax=Planktosalinus lacus TaxID=1526573 RepID=A0A8J2YAC7_9FLAO|nr:esterase [Planktosalinus lacus]GGD91034.1 esterase [Planktosalinus lacus]
MHSLEKEVSYKTINTYSTLNEHTENTKNIWVCFHGLGYLSKYFINYFQDLDQEKNYIIAPQAPSKYYQGKSFKYVGASWLTKENTMLETQNVLKYLDAVYANENLQNSLNKLILFGFSQGVSVGLRWVAHRKINCKAILIHSGGIPKELTAADFTFLSENTKVYLIYGKQDEYINEERIQAEKLLAEKLFGKRINIMSFDGKHIVNTTLIAKIAKELSESN